MLKALIFDVDGTQAGAERDGHREALNVVFRKYELDGRWDECCMVNYWLCTGAEWTIRNIHKEKTRIYRDLLAQASILLRPGVERLLREARAAHMQLAIATTASLSMSRHF